MGNSNLKNKQNIDQENNQITVNKSFLKSVSENINSQISNTIVNDAKGCSADINNNQAITIKKLNIKGSFKFDSNQKQTAALTFSCVQATAVRNKASSNILADLTNNLASNATSEAISLLDSKAEQEAKSGFGATGTIDQEIKIKQRNTSNSTNDVNKDITNVFENIIENNFSSETVSKCISQVNNSQNLTIEELNIDDKAIIAIDQDQAADVIAKCIQESDIGGDIINSAQTKFDVKVVDDISSKTDQKGVSVTSQSAVAEGLMPACGGCMGSIVIIGIVFFIISKGGGVLPAPVRGGLYLICGIGIISAFVYFLYKLIKK